EPVTLDEAKSHARIETTADDTLVTGLIAAARQLVEKITHRALITQTWTLTLDAWPRNYSSQDDWWDGLRDGAITMVDTSDEVEIRKAPFAAITKVETVNEDGTKTIWDPTNYYTTTRQQFGRLTKKAGSIWPILAVPVRQRGGILITFTSGYGPNASDVPMA